MKNTRGKLRIRMLSNSGVCLGAAAPKIPYTRYFCRLGTYWQLSIRADLGAMVKYFTNTDPARSAPRSGAAGAGADRQTQIQIGCSRSGWAPGTRHPAPGTRCTPRTDPDRVLGDRVLGAAAGAQHTTPGTRCSRIAGHLAHLAHLAHGTRCPAPSTDPVL